MNNQYETLNLSELKALAYDLIGMIEATNNQLRSVNDEIRMRVLAETSNVPTQKEQEKDETTSTAE